MKPTPEELEKYASLAQSPAGQDLLHLLRQRGGGQLDDAMAQAAQGDYQAAQAALNTLLTAPEIQALLRQLEAQL